MAAGCIGTKVDFSSLVPLGSLPKSWWPKREVWTDWGGGRARGCPTPCPVPGMAPRSALKRQALDPSRLDLHGVAGGAGWGKPRPWNAATEQPLPPGSGRHSVVRVGVSGVGRLSGHRRFRGPEEPSACTFTTPGPKALHTGQGEPGLGPEHLWLRSPVSGTSRAQAHPRAWPLFPALPGPHPWGQPSRQGPQTGLSP